MAFHKLVVIVKRSSGKDDEFLVARQTPPPMPPGDEYEQYADSELWDLPSALLNHLDGDRRSDVVIGRGDSCSEKVDLRMFDVQLALGLALAQVGLVADSGGQWELYRYDEEPEFGPGPPVNTLFILGKLKSEEANLQDFGRWISIQVALKLLLEVNPTNERIGPLVTTGILSDRTAKLRRWDVPSSLNFQEYPPGVTLVPMRSRTAKPFWTTNLVVVAPNDTVNSFGESNLCSSGDALLMDPGCCSEHHSQLADVIAALPRKLVVFVTHHHHDHIDGLSIIQKCNPDAILLAHENTMNRIGKDKWSHNYSPVSGGEILWIGGQKLEVVFAPGHTDGHLALLHISTNALVVGDHCVGQGSALLDVTSGGNMKDYFKSTYNFMERSPHVIIPMHGRVNVWPKQMLCGYLKHRRDRELSIMKAIETGARTLYDIVSVSYADVDVKLWLPASSNVRIHVDYLAYQGKLPKEFSLPSFQASCGLSFLSRWLWSCLNYGIFARCQRTSATVGLVAAIACGGIGVVWTVGRKFGS